MSLKTGMLCVKCKVVLNSEDEIFATSCGHLYHFLCLRECHSKSYKCCYCETYKPCIFKMFLEFGNVIPSWEDQTKTIELYSKLEKSKSDVAFLDEKYKVSQVLVQQLEGKLKKFNDTLNSKNVAISNLEERTEQLQLINNVLNTEKEQLVKNLSCESKTKKLEETNSTSHYKMQTNNKELSYETTKKKANMIYGLFEKFGIVTGNNGIDNNENASNSNESNILEEISNFDLREISNSTKNLKEHQNEDAENNTVQNSDNNQQIIGENNRITICNYRLKTLDKFGPEQCVLYVAGKIKIKLLVEEIHKVIVIKKNVRMASLLVYFKDNSLKRRFLSNKKHLKKFPQTNFLEIEE